MRQADANARVGTGDIGKPVKSVSAVAQGSCQTIIHWAVKLIVVTQDFPLVADRLANAVGDHTAVPVRTKYWNVVELLKILIVQTTAEIPAQATVLGVG